MRDIELGSTKLEQYFRHLKKYKNTKRKNRPLLRVLDPSNIFQSRTCCFEILYFYFLRRSDFDLL